MINFIQAWIATHSKDERGATAVEYGLMVALIGLLIIGAVFALGGALTDLFTDASTEVGTPTGTR